MATRQITTCKAYYPSLLSVLSSLSSKLTLLENMPDDDNPLVTVWLTSVKSTLELLHQSGTKLAGSPGVDLFDLDRILDAYFCEAKTVEQISVDEMLSPDLISEIIQSSDRYLNARAD